MCGFFGLPDGGDLTEQSFFHQHSSAGLTSGRGYQLTAIPPFKKCIGGVWAWDPGYIRHAHTIILEQRDN